MECSICKKYPATAIVWTAVSSEDQMAFVKPELLCSTCLIIKFGMGNYGANEHPLAMDFTALKQIGAPCYKAIFLREELVHNEFQSSHWKRLLEDICGAAIPIRPSEGSNSSS